MRSSLIATFPSNFQNKAGFLGQEFFQNILTNFEAAIVTAASKRSIN